MGVWAEAMRSLTSADETTDLNLVLRVINDNHTIPVIVTDEKGRVTTSRNLRLRYRTSRDSVKQVNEALARLKAGGHSMRISLGTDEVGDTHTTALYIYYGQSLLLQRLAWFPYVQLGVVTVFLLVALLALLSTKRAEQNKVWVGLTKETAHQLGTPISSLMAWMASDARNPSRRCTHRRNGGRRPPIGDGGRTLFENRQCAEITSRDGWTDCGARGGIHRAPHPEIGEADGRPAR